MSGYFNYNKPAAQILKDLIFATNGFMLPSLGVLFDTPIAVTPLVADRYQRDTVIKVSMDPSVPYQAWQGNLTFLYKRINLADFIAVQDPVVPITVAAYPTDTYTLLDQINAYYGLQLSQADVVNTSYAAPVWPITVTAAANSLAFSGAMNLNVDGVVAPAPTDGTSTTGGTTTGGTTGTGTSGGTDGTTPVLPGDGFDINGETGVILN